MRKLDDIRRYYAEEIRAVAKIRSEALVAALAKVPREHFLGPGPWQILSQAARALTSADGRKRTVEDSEMWSLASNGRLVIDCTERASGATAKSTTLTYKKW